MPLHAVRFVSLHSLSPPIVRARTGSKLKYQRYEDDRPVAQPSFETQRYRTLEAVQETEEQELVAKLVLSVKENQRSNRQSGQFTITM